MYCLRQTNKKIIRFIMSVQKKNKRRYNLHYRIRKQGFRLATKQKTNSVVGINGRFECVKVRQAVPVPPWSR